MRTKKENTVFDKASYQSIVHGTQNAASYIERLLLFIKDQTGFAPDVNEIKNILLTKVNPASFLLDKIVAQNCSRYDIDDLTKNQKIGIMHKLSSLISHISWPTQLEKYVHFKDGKAIFSDGWTDEIMKDSYIPIAGTSLKAYSQCEAIKELLNTSRELFDGRQLPRVVGLLWNDYTSKFEIDNEFWAANAQGR